MNFTIETILLILSISQGIFLSLTVLIMHKKNIAANKILSLILLLSCCMLSTRILIVNATEICVIQRFAMFETFIFLFGPLGYVYVKRLLQRGQENFRLSLYHFIPAILYFLFLASFHLISSEEFKQKLISGHYNISFFIAELSALLYNIFYLILSIRLFRVLKHQEKEQLSFAQSSIHFIKVALIAITVVMIIWLVVFIMTYIIKIRSGWINYNSIWIAISSLNYIVGFYALTQPEIFRIKLIQKTKEKQPRLSDHEILKLKIALSHSMEEDHVYLIHDLTLSDLAGRLETTTNNLSWLINNVYDKSFYDFINAYRVNAFLAKVEKGEHIKQTFLSLSYDVGFNSKSTFNKAFKAIYNETPSTYVRSLKV